MFCLGVRVRVKNERQQVFDAISCFMTSQSCQIMSFTQSNEYLVFICKGRFTKTKLCLSPDMNHVIEDISKNIEGAFKIKCIFNKIKRDTFLHHCIIREGTFSGTFSEHIDWNWWQPMLKNTHLKKWQLKWSQYCIFCTQVEFIDKSVRFTLSGSIENGHFTIIICEGNVNLHNGNVDFPGLRLLLKQL